MYLNQQNQLMLMDLLCKYINIPIGTLVPNFIALSISSTEPIPSYNANIASLIYGIKTRFAINPGISYAVTVSFFIYLAKLYINIYKIIL